MNLNRLREYEERGLLTSQRHPSLPLTIWNYTARAQYDRGWDEVTMACRGLVTDDDGRVWARPFPKFFNLDEYELVTGRPLPDEPFEVYEKLDGSLIIVLRYGQAKVIASRGSFISSQARWAEEWLRDFVPDAGYTYLFEAIYPENRVVVNYGNREDIVWLRTIATETGEEIEMPPAGAFTAVHRLPHTGGFESLPQEPNTEGYVLYFPRSGLRLKVKTAEYVRLHRLLTATSPRTIFEAVRDGVPFEEFLEHVPDEFYAWVMQTRERILLDRSRVVQQVQDAELELDSRAPRKDVALHIQSRLPPHLRPIAFMMLDGKDYDAYVWKLVGQQLPAEPFRKDPDS